MTHPSVETYARHVNPAFVKLLGLLGYGRVFERARGTRVWDHEGREYLDLLAGFGATSLGHRHPALVEKLTQELSTARPDLVHVGPSPAMAELAAELAAPPLECVLFSTSGGEAVEAAMKLARAATGRPGLIYCRDGFHGTGLGALSVMGHPRLRAPFEPLLADMKPVPFGDLEALRGALDSRVGAFLLEPIQGEGGVRLPPPGYLSEARRLCARNGSLLILDEVQTGLGRTGSLYAYQAEEVVPDALVLGKALGGGMLPVSAVLTTRKLHQKAYGTMDRFDLHGSTYAGYALGCAAARATLSVLRQEGLVERSAERGQQLLEGLRRRLDGHPMVRDIRGRGLLVGIELGPTHPFKRAVARNVFGQWLALRLLERGFLCQPAALRWDVLKVEPPLTIEPDEVDRAVEAIGDVLDAYRRLFPLLHDLGRRLGRQFLRGWTF